MGCAAAAPKVKGNDFSSVLIKKIVISHFNSVIYRYGDPNIHTIMKAIDVKFTSNSAFNAYFSRAVGIVQLKRSQHILFLKKHVTLWNLKLAEFVRELYVI